MIPKAYEDYLSTAYEDYLPKVYEDNSPQVKGLANGKALRQSHRTLTNPCFGFCLISPLFVQQARVQQGRATLL